MLANIVGTFPAGWEDNNSPLHSAVFHIIVSVVFIDSFTTIASQFL